MNTIVIKPQPSLKAMATENVIREYTEAIHTVNVSYGVVSSNMSGMSAYATKEEIASSLEKMQEHLEMVKKAIAKAEYFAEKIQDLAVDGEGLSELQQYNSEFWDYQRELRNSGKAN